jgi:hypothetical protein
MVANINNRLKINNKSDGPTHIIYPVYCFANSIQRVVLVLLTDIDTETTDIWTFVKSTHYSPKKQEQLECRILDRNTIFPAKKALKKSSFGSKDKMAFPL